MNTKSNARYIETDKKIRKSFLAELENKPIKNIKVSDICKIVNINRSSFYAHYEDIYGVLQAISNDVGEQFFNRLSNLTVSDSNNVLKKEYLLETLSHILDNKQFYKSYFSSISLDRINQGMDDVFERIIKHQLKELGVSEDSATVHFVFFKAGLIAVIQYWLSTDCLKTPQEIADIIWNSIRESSASISIKSQTR